MTSPRRRPLQRDNLDVEATLKRATLQAPEVELGWSALRAEMRDAGWTATTPAADRRRSTPRITIRCRECDERMTGSAAKDTHTADTGHRAYEYLPALPVGLATAVDYADPTGDLALRLDHLADDLYELEDLWNNVVKSLRQMALVARRYVPDATPAVPACSVSTCDDPVEMTTGGKGYRGMDLIAGHWVARPGTRPVCAKHRSQDRRTA